MSITKTNHRLPCPEGVAWILSVASGIPVTWHLSSSPSPPQMLPHAPPTPDFPSTSHTTPRTQLLCLWPILTSLLLSIILHSQEPSPPPPQLWSVLWTSLMDRSSPAPTLPSRPTLPGTGVRDLQAGGPQGCVGVRVPACLPSTLLARYSPGQKAESPLLAPHRHWEGLTAGLRAGAGLSALAGWRANKRPSFETTLFMCVKGQCSPVISK